VINTEGNVQISYDA